MMQIVHGLDKHKTIFDKHKTLLSDRNIMFN